MDAKGVDKEKWAAVFAAQGFAAILDRRLA